MIDAGAGVRRDLDVCRKDLREGQQQSSQNSVKYHIQGVWVLWSYPSRSLKSTLFAEHPPVNQHQLFIGRCSFFFLFFFSLSAAVRLGKWEGPIKGTINIDTMQQHVVGSLPPHFPDGRSGQKKIPHLSSRLCSQISLHRKHEYITPGGWGTCAWQPGASWDVATEQHTTWQLRSAYGSATKWSEQEVVWV